MTQADQASLDSDYYLINFHALAGFVVTTYADLLLPEEIDWYERVSSLSVASQRLYIRLLSRKRSVFRLALVHYADIENCEQCAQELTCKDLASMQAPDELGLLLGSFTKPELIERLDLSSYRQMPKVNLIEHIASSDSQAHYRQKLQTADRWVTPQGHASWMLMQLCFFGNLYQDSSEFVVRQLGNVQYETYPLDSASRAFKTREQIEAHWRYYECEALFDNLDLRDTTSLLALADKLPVWNEEDINLRRRVDRLRNRIARQLERLGQHDESMRLYQLSSHPPARERRVRHCISINHYQAGLDLASQMADAPYNEAERLVALRLINECRRGLGLSVAKQRVFKPDTTTLVLHNDGSRVERLARRFYANKGACFHTENTLVNGVLGLFIWDIIFHPLPGAFFNPFQIAPADFYQPQFRERRSALLCDRFTELNDGVSFSNRVICAFEQHVGKLNPLVRWQGLSAELLRLSIERIPLTHWRVMFNRIMADTREHTSGFPDLVLFPDTGGYEFIEIKGPGDALQANQRRWMKYFDKHGIACRLVHVRYRQSTPLPDVVQSKLDSVGTGTPDADTPDADIPDTDLPLSDLLGNFFTDVASAKHHGLQRPMARTIKASHNLVEEKAGEERAGEEKLADEKACEGKVCEGKVCEGKLAEEKAGE